MQTAPGQLLAETQTSAGERDSFRLTDAVFYLRHPELRGRPIPNGNLGLAQEWQSVLREVVTPALASSGPGRRSGSSTQPVPVPARDADVRETLAIAGRAVPGISGVTIARLIEQWRPAIAPEIPAALLLAFIRYESGGKFADATHGTAKNRYTQPPFYEIGLFQTPAGMHGTCSSGDHGSWQFPPPGREVPGDRSTWAQLCNSIGANPAEWQNPTTQVRVGLKDLAGSARRIRQAYPELFPTPGSDWDLRMAVLLPFARGGGFARAFLNSFRRELGSLRETERWEFLRGKRVRSGQGRSWVFDPANVDEKMALASKLGGAPQGA